MTKSLKIFFLLIIIAAFSGCSIFKKGCHCPKFDLDKIPHKTIYNQIPNR
jgi:hypothetical protein